MKFLPLPLPIDFSSKLTKSFFAIKSSLLLNDWNQAKLSWNNPWRLWTILSLQRYRKLYFILRKLWKLHLFILTIFFSPDSAILILGELLFIIMNQNYTSNIMKNWRLFTWQDSSNEAIAFTKHWGSLHQMMS